MQFSVIEQANPQKIVKLTFTVLGVWGKDMVEKKSAYALVLDMGRLQ